MARFANAPSLAPKSSPFGIGSHPQRVYTHNFAPGFAPSDAHAELFNAAVSGMLADQFYEKAEQRVDRLIALVPKCDPEWLKGFIPWLRTGAMLRSAPVVIAAEYARAKFPGGRQVVASALQRADEPGEMLGYWMSRYGRNVPKPVKRGVADAVQRLYTERAAMRYDGTGQTWRFGDVIEVCHPKTNSEWQPALFKFLLDRRRHGGVVVESQLPTVAATLAFEGAEERNVFTLDRFISDTKAVISWERVAGWLPGGMTAGAWEALIPTMGYMALMRNLNNFDKAGISKGAQDNVRRMLTDFMAIRESRVLPFRFQTAYKNLEADTYKVVLGTAADLALGNLPSFPGNTLIMVDCSQSMSHAVGDGRSRNPLSMSECAGFQAEALARKCERAAIVCYNSQPLTAHAPKNHVGILTAANDPCYRPNGNTNTWRSTRYVFERDTFHRVVIITDEQSSDADDGSIKVPVITWNIAGYRPHQAAHGQRNRFFVAGYNDTVLSTLPAVIAAGADGRWPWE